MKIFLLRHGQTDWNLEWRMQGQTDIPLNEKGILQAEEAAEKYKAIPFDLILTSPLVRAKKTAEIIAKPHNLEVKVDQRLKEMNFGEMEGRTPQDDKDNPNRKYYFEEPEKYVPSKNGETFEEVDARVKSLLKELKQSEGIYNCVLLSSHGALCKAILRAVQNKPLSKFWDSPPQENCSLIELEI